MKLRILAITSVAALANLGSAVIPEKCIVPTSAEPAGITRGEPVNIAPAVQEIGTSGTHFFGLKTCTSISSGKLTSIQFLLRTTGSDELYKMPQVGPELPKDLVECKYKKLEIANYYIDRVTIYETEAGVEAMRFAVGDLGETFGVVPEGATETVMNFTEEQ